MNEAQKPSKKITQNDQNVIFTHSHVITNLSDFLKHEWRCLALNESEGGDGRCQTKKQAKKHYMHKHDILHNL